MCAHSCDLCRCANAAFGLYKSLVIENSAFSIVRDKPLRWPAGGAVRLFNMSSGEPAVGKEQTNSLRYPRPGQVDGAELIISWSRGVG
jgi:hypothetical protein